MLAILFPILADTATAAAPINRTAICMFVGFVAVTLVITFFSARKTTGSSAYFAAGRRITGWQNGLAVAGDYMSAASFLGIAGMIAFKGYDGFMYSVGFLVAYLTVLLIVAEPLRNAGKYTMADVLAYRLSPRPVRAMASLSTITVSTFYMIAQMIGAGQLIKLLLSGVVSYEWAVTGVGILMIVYVVFGGMLATTWVQRHHSPQRFGAESLPLQPLQLFRRHRSCADQGRGWQNGDQGFPATRSRIRPHGRKPLGAG